MMGMFDEVTCKYPLPVDGANSLLYQTKSLGCEMEYFEIREDGSLWKEHYDIEDRSDQNATGFMRMAGCMTRVNRHWKPARTYTGEIRFYTSLDDSQSGKDSGWLEWSAYFESGLLVCVNLLSHILPKIPLDKSKSVV